MDDGSKLKEAINVSYRTLSYRNRSRKELEQKLKEKGFKKDIIQKTITYLQERNYINDREFARQWGQLKIAQSFYGKYLLERELHQKGIDPDTSNEVIEELYREADEIKIAEQLSIKKMKLYKNLETEVAKRRLVSLLQRKGFSDDIVFKVIKKVLDTVTL